MPYRGMNRAELDRAYNNREAVPNTVEIIADWDERSARVRRDRPAHLDLRYGEMPRERLDLFPVGKAGAPTLAYIHGGYWQISDKEGYSFIAPGALARGFNVAVVEYTLAPEARLDRIVAEVRRAMLWLGEHLGDFGGDPARLYVAGHSAGGHLAATAMSLREISGGLAISGIYDLEPIRLCYLNDKLGLDEEEALRNSPLFNLPAMAGPLVTAYGTSELPELCRQSATHAQAWAERGLAGRLLPVDGADHFTILEALADPDGVLCEAVAALDAG